MGDEFNTDGMLDIYLFENTQLLDSLQEICLEQQDAECFDDDAINEIFRTMHTIKGSSGIMMFDNITQAAHRLEDVFFYLRESKPENVPHMELVEHVLSTADFITGEMDKIAEGETADGDPSELLETLDEFLDKIKGGKGEKKKKIPENTYVQPTQLYIAPAATKKSEDEGYYRIVLTYNPEIQLANVHAYKTIYALKNIAEDIIYYPENIISDEGTAEEIIANGFHIMMQTQKSEQELRSYMPTGYDLQQVEFFPCSQSEFMAGFNEQLMAPADAIDLESTVEEIRQRSQASPDKEEEKKPEMAPGDFVVENKAPGKKKTLAKDKPKKNDKQAFITVDIAKMDQLMDLIGELVISESVVLQNPDLKVPGLKLDNFNKAAAQLAKNSTELQNVIMSMRMVPLTNTFQKMNRIVFDASRKLGKQIEFIMIGDNTEVDKNIIEHISDPLMHLVRNSVDHGVEMPEERIAAGKDPKGHITLEAKNEAGKVVISVTDDGGGLDRNKIIAKARRQGLLDPNKPDASYSDKEVNMLITRPGFSTNEVVTELSGRGVGMDVVVSNIQQIGGSLEIESDFGHGSAMIMKIPLTLAIIDGVVMEVGNCSFVMETGVVKEFVSVKKEMVRREPTGEEFVMIRGEAYPVLRVGDWYHLRDYETDVEKGMMVIIEVDKSNICLFVDRLVGKQEIVVKPIPDYVKKVKGLSGCTQLGDGSIALILDAASIVE